MNRTIRAWALTSLLLFTVLALLPAAEARAEHTRYWRQNSFAKFEKGTADGVAIRSDGLLTPAPRFVQFADPGLPYLWALRLDSHGDLYAAGGSSARVVRLDGAGKSTTVFESPELAAQDIVLDAKGNLYVATSPDGKIYRVTPDGQKSVFYDPKTKYIWALALDTHGNLFAGTGDNGKIFVISPTGDGKLFYQTDEGHARALAFDSHGNLLVGTDSNGLVLRVEVRSGAMSSAEAGAAFVLYDTGQREVTSLRVAPDGTVYAAASGEKSSTQLTSPSSAQGSTSQGATPKSGLTITVTPSGVSAPTVSPSIASFFPVAGGGSKIFRIAPDGSPEEIWESTDEFVYALGPSTAGGILAGTGNAGDILRIDGREYYSKLAKASASQVTAFVAAPDGRIYAATANPGKIFALGPESATDGSFISEAFDAKIFSRWGRIIWQGQGPAAGNAKFFSRSGNTADPDHNWSEWSGPYTNAADASISSPPARFIQWKVTFAKDEGKRSGVAWVNVAYQPRNIAPEMDDIVVQQPGIRAQSIAAQMGTGAIQPVALEMPRARGAAVNMAQEQNEGQGGPTHIDIPPQGYRERGYQSVLWSAHDDNDDDLLYAVYYRAEGSQDWTLLKDKLTEKFYSWDSTSMPDGAYYLKITVTDAPSNPPADALAAERESDRFEVVNKPPAIEDLRATASNGAATVEFTAHASGTELERAEYSVDSGDWLLLFPVGILTDAPIEHYRREISGLAPGEHTVGVRAYDRYENVVTAQVRFTVPATEKH
jgi:sugar lactone lactonase YvrE